MLVKKRIGIIINENDGKPLFSGNYYYWDADLARIVMQYVHDFCPDVKFKTSHKDSFETLFWENSRNGVELCGTSDSLDKPGVLIPEVDLDKFIEALDLIHKESERPGLPEGNRNFMHDFSVPNPRIMKSAWRVSTGFTRKLLVLWGYSAPTGDAVVLPLTPTSSKWADASERVDLKKLLRESFLLSKHKLNWKKLLRILGFVFLLLFLLLLLLLGYMKFNEIYNHKCVKCEGKTHFVVKYFLFECDKCKKTEKECDCTSDSNTRIELIREKVTEAKNKAEQAGKQAEEAKNKAEQVGKQAEEAKNKAEQAKNKAKIQSNEPNIDEPVKEKIKQIETFAGETVDQAKEAKFEAEQTVEQAKQAENQAKEAKAKTEQLEEQLKIIEEMGELTGVLSPSDMEELKQIEEQAETLADQAKEAKSVAEQAEKQAEEAKNKTEQVEEQIKELVNGSAPAGSSDGTPAGPADGTPGGPADGTPGGPADGTPAGPADGTPGGSSDGTPGGSSDGTPAGPSDDTPGDPADGTPGGSSDGTPGGSADGTPGGSSDGTPGGSSDGTPGGSADGTPGGSAGKLPAEPMIADYTFSVVLTHKDDRVDKSDAMFTVQPDRSLEKIPYVVNNWTVNGKLVKRGFFSNLFSDISVSFADDQKSITIKGLSNRKKYVISAYVTIDEKDQKVLPYQWNNTDPPVWLIARVGKNDTDYQVICTNSSNTEFTVKEWAKPVFKDANDKDISERFTLKTKEPYDDFKKIHYLWTQDYIGEYKLELGATVVPQSGKDKGKECKIKNTYVLINGSASSNLLTLKFANAKNKIYHCLSTNTDGSQQNGTACAVSNHYLLTNYHVAVGAIPEFYGGATYTVDKNKVLMISNEHENLYAKVIKADRESDLALLELCDDKGNATDFVMKQWFTVSEKAPENNTKVFAVGYPAGTVRFGAPVFTVGKVIHIEADSRGEIVAHDSNIQQGYSGGPLISMDNDHEIVGINTSNKFELDRRGNQIILNDNAISPSEIRKKFPEIFNAKR